MLLMTSTLRFLQCSSARAANCEEVMMMSLE
jgi:hypothetical protein